MSVVKMIYYIYFVLLVFKIVFSQEIGENCRLNDRSLGKCEIFNKCETAMTELRQGNTPVTCGFQGKEPNVCCGNSQKQANQKSVQNCKLYSSILAQTPRINNKFLIGGQKSNPLEFRHMAALGYGQENNINWNCGGTLISDQFVLTAAHCSMSRQFGTVKWVRLGDLDLSSSNDDAAPQHFKVMSIIRHPEYKGTAKYNDIALIKLDRKVQFTSYVIPACLHTTFEVGTNKLIAIGWGVLEFNGAKSDTLMKVDLDVFSEASCKSIYQPDRTLARGINFNSQICAGGKNVVKDTCEGDSGGPLLLRMSEPSGMYQVVGVTSFGRPCGNANVPGVYSRVSHYVPWIEKVVWP